MQYDTPCIVTDIEGCTELIKDGINGYVVPLDMEFDVKRILSIPKISNYENNAKQKWIEYLGDAEYIEKEIKIMLKVKATQDFSLLRFGEIKNLVRKNKDNNKVGKLYTGDIFECNEELGEYLTGKNDKNITVIQILETIQEEVKKEVKKTTTRKTTKK